MSSGEVVLGRGLPGPRPQPLGALPWPAGMLVLPGVPGAAEVAAALVEGREPAQWPPGLEFVRLALAGDADAAARAVVGVDPTAAYNRAVLVGGTAAWAALDATVGVLGALAATARYSVGLADDPPSAEGLAGEVAAVVRSARATAALERGSADEAVAELGLAAAAALDAGSPVLAATLLGTRAEVLRDQLDDAGAAIADVDAALAALPAAAPDDLRAELLVTRAMASQRLAADTPAVLLDAVRDYLAALEVFREETYPEQFALCNQHLGLAYLTLPMTDAGDRIRLGVAVTALRAALRVFTPQTHPVAWASASLDLANALQYLPSAHPGANLEEAVARYDEVLGRRDPTTDPRGVARVLGNQGNALGHLGRFAEGRECLQRARALFATAGDAEGVAWVDEVAASLTAAEAEHPG